MWILGEHEPSQIDALSLWQANNKYEYLLLFVFVNIWKNKEVNIC